MYSRTGLAVLCSVISYVMCYPATPCHLTEADCLENTSVQVYSKFISEDPEIGTENLDPMHHDVIDGKLSNLTFKLTDTTVIGFKDCKMENVFLNSSNSNMLLQFDLFCPKLLMYGKYNLHGRLIVLPVEGNGDYRIETNTYRISVDSELKLMPGTDGKTYMSIKNFKQTSEPLERVKYDFQNLFNGQKDLADAVLKFVNEHWYEVSKEVQDPVVTANVKKLVKNANKYFKKQPVEVLLSF